MLYLKWIHTSQKLININYNMNKLEQLKPYEDGMDSLFKELFEKFCSSKTITRDRKSVV